MFEKIFENPSPILAALITAVIGTYFTARYAVSKLRNELQSGVQKERYARTLDACQGCWKLLAYTTDVENEKSVFFFERDKATKTTTWKMSKQNAEVFMKELASFFYSSGLGLFLPKEVRPLLFEYRSILFGVLLAEQSNKESIIVLKEPKMIERMKAIHAELILVLRQNVGVMDPNLPENLE